MAIETPPKSVIVRAAVLQTQKSADLLAASSLQFLRSSIPLATSPINSSRSSVFDLQAQESDAPLDGTRTVNPFGTPVYSNLIIPAQAFIDLDGEQRTTDEFILDAVIFTVTQTKNIVKTPIQGRNGTVKEYISDGDYMITINGVITSGASSVFPEDAVSTLREICTATSSLNFHSEFLDIFEITHVVIESYEFPQRQGFRGSQAFTLRCLSDVESGLSDDLPVQTRPSFTASQLTE